MNILFTIQAATRAAQARFNDKTLSVRVLQGKAQVVRVTYTDQGNSIVTPVTDWVPMSDIESTLATMGPAV